MFDEKQEPEKWDAMNANISSQCSFLSTREKTSAGCRCNEKGGKKGIKSVLFAWPLHIIGS